MAIQEKIVIGIDMATEHDSSAICYRGPDGELITIPADEMDKAIKVANKQIAGFKSNV